MKYVSGDPIKWGSCSKFLCICLVQVFRGGEGEEASSGSHAIWPGASQLHWDEVCSDGGQAGPHHHAQQVQGGPCSRD